MARWRIRTIRVASLTPQEAIKQAAAQSGDTLLTNVSVRTALGWAEAYGASGAHYVYIHKDQTVRRFPASAAPPPNPQPAKTFSVWNGNAILHPSLSEIAMRVAALCPDGSRGLEWFPKAGEGGSWQATFDTATLAIHGEDDLSYQTAQMRVMSVRLVPYIVLRGRLEWRQAEHEQIRACVRASGMCILNLEPGAPYWNGPVTPGGVQQWFNDLAVPPENLWLAAIPRQSAVDTLGGDQTMQVWAKNVAGCSWECYEDSPAPDLAPSVALPRTAAWCDAANPWNQIPIIQQSMIDHYKDWPSPSIQVWTLDGN